MSAEHETPEPQVDDLIAAFAPMAIEHVNDEHEDSVLFFARVLSGRRGAAKATVVGLDRTGLDAVVTDPDGEHAVRVDFAEPVADPSGITGALFELMIRARRQSGEPGTTSAERQMAEMAGIRTFLTSVSAVEDVHPHLRRITFAGGDLATFAPLGPDSYCYVILPPPGRDELGIDAGFTWERYGEMPEEERPVGGYYTVRHWRPATGELEMLFVLHGDEGAASRWAMQARPGQPVGLWGPRSSYHPPAGSDHLILVADDTGLPAAAAILEQRPDGMPATVLAEVDHEAEHQALPDGPGIDVTWLYRRGAAPGTTTLLADAVRALVWPAGRPYVWGGAESHAMTAVRKYVRHELGLPRESVDLVGYWRLAR